MAYERYVQGQTVPGTAVQYSGALDMGGASTQITFNPTVDILADCKPARPPHTRARFSLCFLSRCVLLQTFRCAYPVRV